MPSINKSINKYFKLQALLNNPVKGLLGEKPASLLASDTSGGPGSYCDRVTTYHQRALQEAGRRAEVASRQRAEEGEEGLPPVLSRLPQCGLQQRLRPVTQRAAKHWRSCLKGSDTCQDIATLDELTGESPLLDLPACVRAECVCVCNFCAFVSGVVFGMSFGFL